MTISLCLPKTDIIEKFIHRLRLALLARGSTSKSTTRLVFLRGGPRSLKQEGIFRFVFLLHYPIADLFRGNLSAKTSIHPTAKPILLVARTCSLQQQQHQRMAPRQRLNSSTTTTQQQQPDDVDSTGSESTAGLLPEDSKLSSSVSASSKKDLPTEADSARDQHDYFNLVALVRYLIHPLLSPLVIIGLLLWLRGGSSLSLSVSMVFNRWKG